MSSTGTAHSELGLSQGGAAARDVHGSDRGVIGGRTFVPKTPAWLGPAFAIAGVCAPLARAVKPGVCAAALVACPKVREAIRKNSLRILGRELSRQEDTRFARKVIGTFYEFVLDIARTSRMSASELAGVLEKVEGIDAYRATRAQKRGAILVTAHLGTFEAGLAALVSEEKKVRVVFKRDSVSAFERMRAKLHKSLGVIEAPIDDGLATWLSLREALLNDEVVVMQGDRAVPGQRSEVVPFLHGHMRLPTGPVRLAQLTGSPIVPVFALPSEKGRYRVVLKPAIEVHDGDGGLKGNERASAMLRMVADAIASVVKEHPDQWLALEPVFCEDGVDANS